MKDISSGDINEVELLLSKGADPNASCSNVTTVVIHIVALLYFFYSVHSSD